MGNLNAENITNLKNIIDIISSIVTSTAVIVGGIVAWWKWGREKPQAPRCILTHKIFLAHLTARNL